MMDGNCDNVLTEDGWLCLWNAGQSILKTRPGVLKAVEANSNDSDDSIVSAAILKSCSRPSVIATANRGALNLVRVSLEQEMRKMRNNPKILGDLPLVNGENAPEIKSTQPPPNGKKSSIKNSELKQIILLLDEEDLNIPSEVRPMVCAARAQWIYFSESIRNALIVWARSEHHQRYLANPDNVGEGGYANGSGGTTGNLSSAIIRLEREIVDFKRNRSRWGI